MDILAATLSPVSGVALLIALLLGGVILYRRTKTKQSLLFAVSVGVVCVGRILQLFAPIEPATADSSGMFSPLWYAATIVASVGSIGAAIFFVWVALGVPPRHEK